MSKLTLFHYTISVNEETEFEEERKERPHSVFQVEFS